MFKRTYRKEAQQRLRSAVDKYENVCKSLQDAAASLYQKRVKRGVETIKLCESYINTLANSPKEFSKVIAELKFQLKEITGKDWELIDAGNNKNFVAGSTAGAGLVAGAGLAFLGPTAAMALLEQIDQDYKTTVANIIATYEKLDNLAQAAFNPSLNVELRLQASIKLAVAYNVHDSNIIHNVDELDLFMFS
ncbi:hypothetical protein [Nostoc punctiforme]|uniref:Uncharacterized protein n=1 Tax=Nostoc punctiforme (strain ATCC 29133 / PCC 73102) TaxID=63737 RepID=B2J844_NOSP7|nr:hypothetical protein [Nostoc punctiforme]ACC79293.1 hypothetical protein Npun_R0520 [Nostoc punctiforme PCC 73102]